MYIFSVVVLAFYCDPAWMQAWASLALAILTLLTLIVLYFYARDTRRIANASVLQVQNAQVPFLALKKTSSTDWDLENQGNSTALNISLDEEYDYPLFGEEIKRSTPRWFSSISVGQCCSALSYSTGQRLVNCEIRYESLDGRKFATHVKLVDGTYITHFEKLDPPTAF